MPHRHALPLAALLAGVGLLAGACSPAPATRATGGPGRPGPTWATGAPIRVVMNDRFRYRPDSIVVWAGRRVTFAVTNAGRLPHEFVLGDRATQLDHERRMRLAPPTGGHTHGYGPADYPTPDAPGALTVPPGTTRRLTWTFDEPGIVLYGCHILGHWTAGMRGTIVVLARDRPRPLPALSPLPG